jgi:hypothetical protein
VNTAWNLDLDDYALDEAIQRGRHRLQDFMLVLTLTARRRSVSEIAKQLDCSRDRVIWVQHVLALRTQRGRGRGLGAWPRSEAKR